MMNQIFFMYSYKAHYEHSGKELMCVFTDPAILCQYLLSMKETGQIDDNDMEMLTWHQRTQGKDMNYLIKIH